MWPIVREALADASPPIRRQIRWLVALWCLLVLAQMWDSRNAEGAAGVAEFLSAVFGATGVALLGAAHTLQRTMDEAGQPASAAPATRRRSSKSSWRFRRWASRQVSRSERPLR